MNVHSSKGRLDGSPRRGIALVITLLMLSVVTITAVAFLAVSRRERASVATAAEQADARAMVDTALRHAEGRILSRIAATTNRLASVSYFVSTNYANPRFRNQPGSHYVETRDYRQLTNVSYFRNSNSLPFNLLIAGQRDEYARMLGTSTTIPVLPCSSRRTGIRDCRWISGSIWISIETVSSRPTVRFLNWTGSDVPSRPR